MSGPALNVKPTAATSIVLHRYVGLSRSNSNESCLADSLPDYAISESGPEEGVAAAEAATAERKKNWTRATLPPPLTVAIARGPM